MINRIMRASGGTRGLAWTAAACITVSLLVMIFVSVAGPSIVVPAMAHAPDGAPPWWISLRLGKPTALFLAWGAAVIGAVGVGAGLLAVSRGARVPVRPLLAVSFIVIAVFTFLPAAGTTDTQSYAIDGNMIVLHHSPYVFTPATMVTLGDKLAVGSPYTWAHQLSDYGPIASAEEWVSAELGGTSMALITFWLKLLVALAFGAVALLLDRLLRDNPAMRLRAHLLWSLNPLLLWEIVASGHVDGLAIAFGLAGLAALRFTPDGVKPTLARCAAAGALLAAAACTKSPYVLFLVAALWAVRRSPARIASLLGGWLCVTVVSYAIAGWPAVKVLSQRGQQITWDNLYQVLYRPFGLARAARLGQHPRLGLPAGAGAVPRRRRARLLPAARPRSRASGRQPGAGAEPGLDLLLAVPAPLVRRHDHRPARALPVVRAGRARPGQALLRRRHLHGVGAHLPGCPGSSSSSSSRATGSRRASGSSPPPR